MVDAGGSTVGKDGNSTGLGNQTDLRLLGYIRSQSEVVLTSGRTARADNIKMPRTADLAILSAAGVESLTLEPKPNQRLVLLGPEQAGSYVEALSSLRNLGYQNIQLEFGVSGLAALLSEIDCCVISGRAETGVKLFQEQYGIIQSACFELEDLFVAVGSGRGRG